MWRRITNPKNKLIRRTRAKITKIKVVLNEGDEGDVLFISKELGVKCLTKCLTEANDECRKKVVNINLVVMEMMSSLGRQAIVVHAQ